MNILYLHKKNVLLELLRGLRVAASPGESMVSHPKTTKLSCLELVKAAKLIPSTANMQSQWQGTTSETNRNTEHPPISSSSVSLKSSTSSWRYMLKTSRKFKVLLRIQYCANFDFGSYTQTLCLK